MYDNNTFLKQKYTKLKKMTLSVPRKQAWVKCREKKNEYFLKEPLFFLVQT